MLAEKDINVQKFFTNDERWCVNRTVVPEKRLFTPPQMTRKYTVTSKYRWRMDKLRLSEEQNKATTVCYQPMFIMWNVQVVSLLRVIHFTLNSLHGCKHACVEPCSLVLPYLVHFILEKGFNVSTKVDCESWSVRAPVMWLYTTAHRI